MPAHLAFWVDAEAFHALDVGNHMRFPDQDRANAQRVQVVADIHLAHAERGMQDRGAVGRHVAPGIHAVARGATGWRLAIGGFEGHAPSSQRIDIGGPDRRMAGATKVIIPKLVTHNEQNILSRHSSKPPSAEHPHAASEVAERSKSYRIFGIPFQVLWIYNTCFTHILPRFS